MKTILRICLSLLLFGGAAFADDFKSDGVKIHYIVEGKGEPVILIHGFTASALMNWQLPGVVAELAKNYQVIALDCRGHGQSDKPEADDAYGVKMVEDVVRLMDHLKIEKAHLVGYSMGGMITMKFVVLHPDRVRSAVLGGMGWMKDGGLLQKFWENSGKRENATAADACARGFAKLAVTEKEVRAIKVPCAVIVGSTDPVKALYVEPLRQIRPDIPVKLIEGAGHIACILNPEFKTEIKAFLDKNVEKQK